MSEDGTEHSRFWAGRAVAMRHSARLVRAPAALTVLGDTIAGAMASGDPLRGKRSLLPVASVALYWSGMALNDWADAEVDAVERPQRPIPSGSVSRSAALAVSGTLTAAGLGVARLAGGQDAARSAALLACAVWWYDTAGKATPLGPVAMAACRGLDVVLGAGAGAPRSGRVAAMLVAGHTLGITALSAGEVQGTSRRAAVGALTGTLAVAMVLSLMPARSRRHRLLSLCYAALYAGMVGRAQLRAVRDPGPLPVRTATAAGIHGMIPLQAAIIARHGTVPSALLGAILPVAVVLGRKVSPT